MTPRPFYWSLRRELWDNRAIWIAPLLTATWVFSMFVLITLVMARPGRVVPPMPYVIAPGFVIVAMALVWLFYTFDALHGERRDRSILFWKSLPVSDRTTVLAKAATALLVLPLVTYATGAALQLGLWLAHKAIGLLMGVSVAAAEPFPLLPSWGLLLYGVAVMTLWLAPILAWNLLVSGWARRAPLVWAALPVIALGKIEELVFRSRHIADRWVSWTTEAYASTNREGLIIDPLNPIAPAEFVGSRSLWVGLAIAALFLVAAVRLRRRQSPL